MSDDTTNRAPVSSTPRSHFPEREARLRAAIEQERQSQPEPDDTDDSALSEEETDGQG